MQAQARTQRQVKVQAHEKAQVQAEAETQVLRVATLGNEMLCCRQTNSHVCVDEG